MTAEVAILTKQCVVMAADSAVSTSDRKVFDTVNKLFALSKEQPVGIMAYNSAHVMGVPVETVIKEFRRLRGSASHQTLDGYAQDFKSFLRSDTRVFSRECREFSLVTQLEDAVNAFVYRLNKHLVRASRSGWSHPSLADAKRAVTAAIEFCENQVAGSNALSQDDTAPADVIRKTLGAQIEEHIESLESYLPMSKELQERLRKVLVGQLRTTADFGGFTGFVIAGFGTDDVFPSLRCFEFHCASGLYELVDDSEPVEIGKIYKSVEGSPIDITAMGLHAQVKPFAQADVMASFIEGHDPLFNVLVTTIVEKYFESKRKDLPKGKASKGTKQLLSQFEGELKDVLATGIKEQTQRQFIDDLMDVVSTMPKEELAILAESLVNLTALKRKASKGSETVGGPTDVCVITKGDGLIWIKRKHYFDHSLNLDFEQRQSGARNNGSEISEG